MTSGSNCLKNFNKLFTSNYMSYLIKKVFLKYFDNFNNMAKWNIMQKYNLQNLRLVHNYDSDINDNQIIVNEENVWR